MAGESQELVFPTGGIDVSTAASEAPPGTAAVGVNVRVNDPFQSRDRGGSRPGLTPWINARTAAGNTPTQHLNTVAHYSPEALLTVLEQDGETQAPGGLVVDTMSSNFPDGPGPTGPGGGPLAPSSPPFPAGFNSRTPSSPPAPYPRYRPDKGSGVQPHRTVGPTVNPVPPPPPPPPSNVTRTYTPFAGAHVAEITGVFAIGPVPVPMSPLPIDLSSSSGINLPIDYYGNYYSAHVDAPLAVWNSTALPTVADLNAICLAAGWSGAPPLDGGPYQSSADT